MAVCQTRQEQQQWVEALTQQCRLARSSSFTPHKPPLTSPPVLPAHVSVWPNPSIQPCSASSVCMSCSLPCDGGGVHKPSSSCSSVSSPVSPSLSPSPRPYLSLPYVVLTKYFASLYRKKVITKRLLRQLAGDHEDLEAARLVKLRRHRTECSIHTGGEFSSDSDTPKQRCSGSQPSSELDSSDSSDGYWAGGGPSVQGPSKAFEVFSPMPSRKQYHLPAPGQASSLHKWRYQASPLPGSLSTSGDSSSSSEGSNPYGYIRYFSPDAPGSPIQEEETPVRRFTYTQPTLEPPIIPQGEKSSSFDDFCHIPKDPWGASNLTEWGHQQEEQLKDITEEHQIECLKPSKGVVTRHIPRVTGPSDPCTNLPSLTLSLSQPTLSPQHSVEDGPPQVPPRAKTVHSSTLTIPAAPMMLASLRPSQQVSLCESSEGSANVCNRTIYEPSSSSGDAADPGKSSWGAEEPEKPLFPFKTKPDIAYYVSSCSGDETGEDGADYYESHRKPEPLVMALSRSEPNLCLPVSDCSDVQNRSQKYSSHYVQLVFPLESPGSKVCNCEAHSHRSSDSGLADVAHHLDRCPLRHDTPGLGRGSGASHCSHSSQLSSSKFLQGTSWYPARAFTPDSLLPTPVTSPNTSAPVSYAEDSLTSLLDSVSLNQTSSEQESGPEEGVYRSGLYAHWWMKASVCPRLLALDRCRKDYLRFKGDKKPDLPPKPKFLKPSYHIRRGGSKGNVVKPVACCAATQTCLPRSQTDHCVHPRLKKLSSHLTPQPSVVMTRDRSFESQASQVSQVTVIPRAQQESESHTDRGSRPGLVTLQVLGKASQESSGTELSSLHSFSESCEGAGQQPHLRDSCEGLDVNFQRRASSHSLHTTATSSSASSVHYKSTLYWQLPATQGGSVQPWPVASQRQDAADKGLGVVRTLAPMEGLHILGRPALPPKPAHLQSWPIQRSRSLPRLPAPASISVHTQSKVPKTALYRHPSLLSQDTHSLENEQYRF